MESEVLISIRDASIFQHDNLVLEHVNIEVKKGEFVYLIGKTGSGKSSLLRTLYADLPLKAGEAEIAGFSLNQLKNREIPFLRRKLGIIFQDFQLLMDRDVSENLRFILKSTGWKKGHEMESRIEEVLKKVGLFTKAHKMPHQLSGGEQQRLGIARALINDPEVIIADEPSGNLDPETTAEILQLLLDLASAGLAVLVATHDLTLFELHRARTLKCDGGVVIDSNLL